MAKNARQKALAEARFAQAEFERAKAASTKAGDIRRESFARAKATGLSLAEIAEAVNLHRSRVDQILHGK
jgi:plasmid maintenance system antidote protein VapI